MSDEVRCGQQDTANNQSTGLRGEDLHAAIAEQGLRANDSRVVDLRCPRVWELNHHRERCVLAAHQDGNCQVNVWLAVRCPALEPGIGTSVDASIGVRRVE